jgi:protein ImuB
MGARRLDLAFHRVDGRVEHIPVGTARPSRDPRHLAGLLAAKLDTVDPGLGIEDMILALYAAEPLPPEQIGVTHRPTTAAAGIAPLLDRIGARLGLDALSRIEPHASHIPERASRHMPVGTGPTPGKYSTAGSAKPPRPVRLFAPPEPVAAAWLLPDDPPFHFTWRRRLYRVRRAAGPERIAAEWWTEEGPVRPGSTRLGAVDAVRDYYRVEDAAGRRFWLFRAGLPGVGPSGGPPPRWFMHGVFA